MRQHILAWVMPTCSAILAAVVIVPSVSRSLFSFLSPHLPSGRWVSQPWFFRALALETAARAHVTDLPDRLDVVAALAQRLPVVHAVPLAEPFEVEQAVGDHAGAVDEAGRLAALAAVVDAAAHGVLALALADLERRLQGHDLRPQPLDLVCGFIASCSG